MHLATLVLQELLQRKKKCVSSLLAIVLGIGVITFILNTITYSGKAIETELDALGANVLILHPSASVNDYYSADLGACEIPEEYVTRLTLSNIEGVENLSPKLSLPTQINNRKIILTGILPKNEFQSKASWQGAGIFSRSKSCGNTHDIFGLQSPKQTLVKKRVIETLAPNQILVGAEVASKLGLQENAQVTLFNQPFQVIAILPQTGTIDDSRVFAHLHTVQQISGKGPVVHAIEVVGCCKEIAHGLISRMTTLLPDAKITTISQLVDTQIKTNQIMKQLSVLFFSIVILIGILSIANDMSGNVRERKKEIGTLLALGAPRLTILKIFLLKALFLGILGGILGYILGTVLAIILGPMVAHVTVLPELDLLCYAIEVSTISALLASYFPIRAATKLDPSAIFREI